MKSLILSFVVVFLSISAARSQSTTQKLQTLDNFIQEGINKWRPPGLAVTVVKDGEIVFKKGYGVRTLGSENLVDENTLFGCMSTTKAFVSAGLAMLVDDGKVNWDDRVIKHLPDFQLKDPYITRELTVRDLLTHRSGLGNTDYLWSLMSISGDSAYHKLREVEKSYSLRSSFIYQNLMYHTAGKVIESLSEKSWGEFLNERIFTPLEMNNTYSLLKTTENVENKADAHYEIDGEIIRIDQMSVDNVGAAGSMWSSITDTGKWIQFLLNEGRKGNDTLIQPSTFKELFKPQQIIPSSEFYPTQQVTKPNWKTYGLGWFQHDYRGKIVQFHTGSLPGMVAIAGMLQDDNIGVYVMGNLDHVELRHAIMYATFDLFLDGELSRDWSTDLYALYHPEKSEEEEANPTLSGEPSLNENELVGKYQHESFGWIEIIKRDGGLKFNMNNTIYGALNHKHYDTYELDFEKRVWGDALITFRMSAQGKTDYLELWGEQFKFLKN